MRYLLAVVLLSGCASMRQRRLAAEQVRCVLAATKLRNASAAAQAASACQIAYQIQGGGF